MIKDILSGVAVVAFYIIGVIIAFAIPVLTVALGINLYNSWQDEPEKPALNVQNDFTPTDRLSSAERAEFMNGCSPDGTDNGYCQCIFNELDEMLSNEEFYKVAEQLLETGDISDEIVTAIENCMEI